ncbi:MAG: transposase [Xanthobacteraceae bacterium]|jgi:transcription elongation factor Elf1
MALSMFNQLTYRFTCPHCGHTEAIVISRLDNVTDWPCEKCGQTTDFRVDPHKSEIEQQRHVASEHDKQERQRGKKVERLD